MWEIANNRRLLFGENRVKEIPDILKWYGYKKAFFVIYDRNAPVFSLINGLLLENGIETVVYDAVKGEPDLHVINNGKDLFLKENCDCVLAVGGGSVLDVAKAVGMMAKNGGLVEQYQMEGKAVTTLPNFYIAVPTTSGTGAEATKVSVVLNNYNGLKKSLYHNTMIADIVILDPTVTVGLNAKITAATGMDALSHAIESYVSLNANPMSEMFGLKAMELITRSLVTACKEPDNVAARGDMLMGSYLGGCAITAGIGIAHIMAQPIGAMYHIPHGDACSIFLPLAMELNLEHSAAKYARIAHALGVGSADKTDIENARAAIDKVKELRKLIGAPDSLLPYMNGEQPDWNNIIETVKKTTGHITCNPRPVDEALYRKIFEMAMA